MVNLLLMLVWSALGFTLGLFIIGAIPFLRSRPRYLMAMGAAIMPLVWALHLLIPARLQHFGPDLLLMMAGIGMVVAGWEGEVELEHRLDDERRGRLRALWELRQVESKGEEAAAVLEPDSTSPTETPEEMRPG